MFHTSEASENQARRNVRLKAERNARQANNLDAYLADRERASARSAAADIADQLRSDMLDRAARYRRAAADLEAAETDIRRTIIADLPYRAEMSD